MHLFSSIMCSLLVITGLQVSVESTGGRSERNTDRPYTSELSVKNGGGWGTWGEKDMCPPGTYAAGFNIMVEDPQGTGDDTALNGIRLLCADPAKIRSSMRSPAVSNSAVASVTSKLGGWGNWKGDKWCLYGFLTSFALQVEAPRGPFIDDTAANNIIFQCTYPYIVGDGTDWGDWGEYSQTCQGKGICGIQTRVEDWQRDGDDTSLNDVRMFCCS